MESAKQLLPVDPVSILADSGPLKRLSEQSCFRSFLGLGSWLTALLKPQLALAVGSFAILLPGLLVVQLVELVAVVVGPGIWLQVAVGRRLEPAGGCQVSVAWLTCSIVATAA